LKDLIGDLSAEADFALQNTLKEKLVEPTALGAIHTRAVLVPARDEGDEIAAIMLAHLLNRSQYKIDTISPLAQSQMLRSLHLGFASSEHWTRAHAFTVKLKARFRRLGSWWGCGG
jgi:hypothetical protein